ncbi:MAG: flagellar biosynthesis protein FlhB [Clostridia bacterium]|nr:flagellar biosynthesis protein FlhB [Clostridia bacterium]
MEHLIFNLQLFSEEKTEQPTAKKKRESREKGQVVTSKDLGSAFAILAVFVFINIFKRDAVTQLRVFMIRLYRDNSMDIDAVFDPVNMMSLLGETGMVILRIALPIVLVALVIGLLFSYLQVGVLFTLEPIKFKLDKISPIKGFKRLFSMRTLVEFAKAVVKGTILLYVAYSYVIGRINVFYESLDYSLEGIAYLLWDITFNIVVRCALLLFVIGVFDFIYKKWQNNKDNMMTKQEIKDEYKQSEGDPLVKSKIKQKQREISMSRMMQDVPKADVIITNPTHYAVAVKYDVARGDAPYVIAKGQNLIATNIKRVATENEVPIIENKPLARALFAQVEIGEFIPSDLYEATAEVLAYVYKLRNNG